MARPGSRPRARRRKPDDLATLVYTSGTTGNPKGAMLTHGNITSNVMAVREFVPFQAGDVALSILPLSHILERMVDFLYLYKGGCIAYAENVTKVADNLQEVKPQFFAAVPRLFEKMRSRVHGQRRRRARRRARKSSIGR